MDYNHTATCICFFCCRVLLLFKLVIKQNFRDCIDYAFCYFKKLLGPSLIEKFDGTEDNASIY